MRSAAIYADFFLPHLRRGARVLDCGCGSGEITAGLRQAIGSVVGIDLELAGLRDATAHVRAESIDDLCFLAADGTALPFADDAFDAAFCHSVLEAATEPGAILRELHRVLVPGGIVGAASVEYGGLLLHGPGSAALRRFYDVRERLWQLERVARPRAGRELRQLLDQAGFVEIRATAHYLSYGTAGEVRAFGEDRARDCLDPWFSSRSLAHGLFSPEELEQTRQAWQHWSRSPSAFAAFAWCRATARKASQRDPVTPNTLTP